MDKTKVTVTVKGNGKLVTGGKVAFDGANVERRMAPACLADLGKDRTYKIEALLGGGNLVRVVDVPQFDPEMDIMAEQIPVDVKEGMSPLELCYPYKP